MGTKIYWLQLLKRKTEALNLIETPSIIDKCKIIDWKANPYDNKIVFWVFEFKKNRGANEKAEKVCISLLNSATDNIAENKGRNDIQKATIDEDSNSFKYNKKQVEKLDVSI